MAEVLPDDMWTPYKHLHKLVDAHLHGHVSDISGLAVGLRKYKQCFINVLKNSPKNSTRREEIVKGIKDGITLPGLGHTTLSKDLVDETLIISDMYDLNEFIALELLCTAHQQMPNHPGLNRGLVAVLLYYDGRKTLATTLKDLFQASEGVSWCVDAPHDVTKFITLYTNGLVADGILLRILEQLEQMDITKELALLSENRALGKPKHHRQVLDLFEEMRMQLANTLFCRSAQCGLPKDVTIALIKYLAKYKPANARGGMDNVTLALLQSLLYALDLSVLQKHEDSADLVRQLPIVAEAGYAASVLDALNNSWECEELRAVALYAFGLAMAALRQAPQAIQANAARIIDQDEYLVEAAIQGKVFDFIYHVLLDNDSLFKVEFYYRRVHILLTDFIELMHSKVTELRARADETARTIQCHQQQGLEAPANLCQDFETLLLIVGRFYSNDQHGLQLVLEYWKPMEGPTGTYSAVSTRSVSLFKFIRLSGDLLPPTLLVPYLKMLAGLSNCQASAQRAFDFLKQGYGVSGSTTLSWEHFFGSLSKYYANLRQEQHAVTDTVYNRNRLMTNRLISPQEMAGLQAVLSVIRAVAAHDEFARIALCDHPNWQPLVVLLGLVGCAVPIPLKTELLLTLAALAKSKETALQLWQNLETSQIIQTIPNTSAFASSGIEAELKQVESRNESYPLTQALLDFLYTLCSTAIPRNLGAGPRRPGCQPYVRFVVDTIFLRFYHLNYKDATEKWAVAEKCLRILHHFVHDYVVEPGHFPGPDGVAQAENVPAGFQVMLQMNTNDKSEVLRLMLHIIDEACVHLDTYTTFAGKAHLEQSALYCLHILELCLAQQELFFYAHFTANCSILLSGINKLLLGVNPRSGRPDHMVNVAKFVTFNSWLQQHALAAVKILAFIVRQPQVTGLILGEFTRTETLANELRHGFVECLEAECVGGAAVAEVADADDEAEQRRDEQETGDDVEMSIKEAIVGLLDDCLPQSSPNLAHYLLGFDITKDIRMTRLQQPGVMEFPSNCIKSLITILDDGVEQMRSNRPPVGAQGRLIERGYQLLYALCYNNKTSDVVLRFLRSCNDFFCRHLSALPFLHGQTACVLGQMTGLLKCVAIELKITANNNQVTQFGNMCKILLSMCPDTDSDSDFASFYPGIGDQTSLTTELMMLGTTDRKAIDRSTGLLVCRLLAALEFEIAPVDRPKFEFFDGSLIQQLLQNCEVAPAKRGLPKLVNIKRLDDVLRGELSVVQTTIASGQMSMILQEKETVLRYALALNVQKSLYASTVRFLDAWGQVTEILFSVAPVFAISAETKQSLIIEILQALLNKVVSFDIAPELANLASSTVLQLLVNLRHCYAQQIDQDGNATTSLLGPNLSLANQTASSTSPKQNSLSLNYILKNIVDWILMSGAASQKLKSNLYTALLNFMHIIRGTSRSSARHEANAAAVNGSNFVSRLDKSLAVRAADGRDANNQTQMAIDVFTGVGDKIVDIICQDCTGGHDICKMLALSCLDMLFDMDPMVSFVQFIARRGYLAHIVDSLIKTDRELCRVLEQVPDNMKALYVYESKMAMLGRVASSHIGAGLLLEHRALGVLSQMKVFDMHPDFQISTYAQQADLSSAFVPPVEQRYQQILFPALSLCDIVLSTLGPENRSAIAQVVSFLLSHGDMIEIVLRAGTPFLSIGLLEELSAITGLIARTANQEYSALSSEAAHGHNHDLGAHLYRLQKLMLSLMPRFILTPATLKDIAKTELPDSVRTDRMMFILRIASNLALYARNAIANHSVDHRTVTVLFSPSVHEGMQRNDITSGTLEVSPSIGLVLSQLKNTVEYFNREKHAHDGLLLQRNSLPSLSLDAKNEVQFDQLTDKLGSKTTELKLCVFLVEHCLYLLWAHLDHYMLNAVPAHNALSHTMSFHQSSTTIGASTTNPDTAWRVTIDDVAQLKKTLNQVLNETFCKHLVATAAQSDGSVDREFVAALLRRIKRLIQFAPQH